MLPRFGTRLALAGCLAAAVWAAQSAVWIDVPFVKQERNGCGAASVAMVIDYWQHHQGRSGSADAAQIQRALYTEKAHGIYASQIERYFDEHGFRVFAFAGEWNDLEQHVRKGRPLIVALKPDSGGLHYVVVAGVDDERRLVLVNDPAERKLLAREWKTFGREWKGAANWTLLAVPREGASSAH